MEQDEVVDCDEEEEAEICEEKDVESVSTMKEKLGVMTLNQVGPGSCTLQALMMGGTHLEGPHEDVSINMNCVSLELLEDGPYVGMEKGRTYFTIRWTVFPWKIMMRPCTLEKQGALFFA